MTSEALSRPAPWRAVAATTLACLFFGSLAVQADPRIRFRRFGIEEGLSNDTVVSIRQDHLGYLWMGTDRGLNRFDGYRFESFHHHPDQPSSLPHDRVNVLLEDHLGRLWVGTELGLAFYDRASKTFHSVPISGLLDTGEEPQVDCLFEDRQEMLWIGTDRGLFRLPMTSAEPGADGVRRGFAGLLPGDPELPDSRVKALAEDQNGSLWIGTRAGLFRLSSVRHRHRLDRFTHDALDPTSLHDDEIYALLSDSRGDLWIGAWGGGGLGRLPADQLLAPRPVFRRFVYPPGDRRGLNATVVKTLLEDAKGTLWVGTQLGGVRLLSPRERERPEPRFLPIEHDPLDSNSLPSSSISALAGDDQGGVWVGTVQWGLGYHIPVTASVTVLRPHPKPGDSPRARRRSTIWESRDGTVWAGTSDGLDRIQWPTEPGGSFQITRYRHDPSDPHSLASDRIYSLFEDSRERLWIGTVKGGLDRLEKEGGRLRFVHHRSESGLASHSIFALFEDAAGVLWVGTYLGLHRMEEEPGEPARFVAYRHQEENPATLSSDVIYAIAEDADGRLWIGTDRGLDRLEQDRQTLVREPVAPNMVVIQLASATDGSLWAATGSHGLVRIDPSSGDWRSWRRRDGLADDGCESLNFDAAGRVWATSSRRLHRLDPATGEIRTFTERDGFLVAPFVHGSFHRGRGGELYLGGDGLAVFKPQELNQPPLLAPVVLRSLELAHQPVSVGLSGPLPSSIESLESLVLRPTNQSFSLEFAALSFHRQELIRYAYRLRGYSDDWVETGADDRQATFTSLSPGTYTFEVRARNDVGSWGPQPASLAVRILPRWYETAWFRAAALLAFLVLPACWIWIRFRRLEAHRRELQELVDRWHLERQERQKWQELSVTASGLARKTTDPLTVIHRLAERLCASEDLSAENREQVSKILDQANQAKTRLDEFRSNTRWQGDGD